MIPPILIRTVPAETSDEVEAMWTTAQSLTPGWQHVTYRDPISPDLFPLTSQAWRSCTSGAQLAGLVRLEALWHHGGVYIDSDVELLAPLEALLELAAFAGWEDANCIPDAVIGAEPHHPPIAECIDFPLSRLRPK